MADRPKGPSLQGREVECRGGSSDPPEEVNKYNLRSPTKENVRTG
jgi:hypothetical protein